MPHGPELAGVTDSKALDPPRRWALYRRIRAAAQAVGIGIVEAEVVDQVNVLRATHLAMALALKRLRPAADFALVDGLPVKGLSVPHEAVVKGDRLSYCIAAASIIAKVTRDHLMADLDAVYPGYGFAEHKGYGTPTHRQVLAERGACPIHRRSFAPVAVGLAPRLPGL
jgi:ribonuclease HII